MSRGFLITVSGIIAVIAAFGAMRWWREHQEAPRPCILNLRAIDPPSTTSIDYVDYDLDGTNDTKILMSPTNCATFIRVDGEWMWLFSGYLRSGFPTNGDGCPITSTSRYSTRPAFLFRDGKWIKIAESNQPSEVRQLDASAPQSPDP